MTVDPPVQPLERSAVDGDIAASSRFSWNCASLVPVTGEILCTTSHLFPV